MQPRRNRFAQWSSTLDAGNQPEKPPHCTERPLLDRLAKVYNQTDGPEQVCVDGRVAPRATPLQVLKAQQRRR